MNKKYIIEFIFLFIILGCSAQEKGHVQLTTMGGFYYPVITINHYGSEKFSPRFSPAYNVGLAYSFPLRKKLMGEARFNFGESSYELRSQIIPSTSWFGPFRTKSLAGRWWIYDSPYIEGQFLVGKTIKSNKLKNHSWNVKVGLGIRKYLGYYGGVGWEGFANSYQPYYANTFEYILYTNRVQPLLCGGISRLVIFKNNTSFSYGAEMSIGLFNDPNGYYHIMGGTPQESGGKIYYNGGYLGIRIGYGFPTHLKKKDAEDNGQIEMPDDHPIHLIPWYDAWFVSVTTYAILPGAKVGNDLLRISFTTSPGIALFAGRRFKINNRLALSPQIGFTSQSLGFLIKEDSSHLQGLYAPKMNMGGNMFFKRESFSSELLFETPLIQKKWFRLTGDVGAGFRIYSGKPYTEAYRFDTLSQGFYLQQEVFQKVSPFFSAGAHCEWPGRLGNLQLGAEFTWNPRYLLNGSYSYFVGTNLENSGSYVMRGTMIGFKLGYLFRTKAVPEKKDGD
jgi:hypothetical protein